MFNKEEVTSWFRLFNTTGIGKVKNYFTKSHNDYAKLSQLN